MRKHLIIAALICLTAGVVLARKYPILHEEPPIAPAHVEPIKPTPIRRAREALPRSEKSLPMSLLANWRVRSDGGTGAQCTGLTDLAYDGAGLGEDCAFNNPQTAIDVSLLGDTITLRAGDSFNGGSEGFIIPNKGAGSSFITITTSDHSTLPTDLATYPTLGPDGYPRRISTAEAINMPKLVGAVEGQPALRIRANAHHWKFDGVEITNALAVDYQVALVLVEGGVVSDFWFEDCFIHPAEETGDINTNYQNRSVEKGIFYSGSRLTVKRCSIQGFTGFGQGVNTGLKLDTNAILWGAGEGDGLIENSLLEGQANNVFTGGSGGIPDPAHTADVTDVTIDPVNGTFTGTFSSTTNLNIGDYFGLFNASIEAEGGCLPAYSGGISACVSGWTNAQVTNKVGNVITATTGLRTSLGYRRHYVEIFHSDNFGNRYPATISGTFTLTFMGQTTAAITYSSNRATLMANIQTALENLSNIAPGDIRLVDDPNWGIFVDFGEHSAMVGNNCPSEGFCGNAWAYPTEIEVMTGNDAGLVGTNADLYIHLKGQEYGSSLRVEAQNTPADGSDSKWKGITLVDVKFLRNIIPKYDVWFQHLGFQKGYIEFKTGLGLEVIGNIFFWDGAQEAPGALVLTPRQDGGCAWCVISGLLVRSNWFQTPVLMGLALKDAIYFGPESFDIEISNNVVNNPAGGIAQQYYSATSNGSYSLIHNTFTLGQGRFMQGHDVAVSVPIRDNIVRAGALLFCLAPDATNVPFDCWPATQLENRKNLIINDQGWLGDIANPSDPINGQWLSDWSDQLYATSIPDVKFVAAGTPFGVKTGYYALADDSPYNNAASDGTDPGVNYTLFATDMGHNPFTGAPAPSLTICKWSTSPRCQTQ